MKNVYATVELHVLRTDLTTDDLPTLLREWGCFGQSQEVVWVVAYDGMTQLRSVVEVARGSEFEVQVDVASVFNAVMAAGATRFMLIHNHPNGKVKPTKQDVELTKQINIAAAVNGRFLEDHWVIGPSEEVWSMTDHKQFTPNPAIQRLYAANSEVSTVWIHREPR